MSTTPRIYVACLASYNNGILHGKWINALQEPEDLHEAVQAVLVTSSIPNAEEWAIHDCEGFGDIRIREHESLDHISQMALFIAENEELGIALLSHFQSDIDAANRALEEDYCGKYESLADFAEEITGETVTIPEPLRYYIDYKAMARDMEFNGDVFTIETGFDQVHVFWNR